jgi:hypothetical protein
MKKVFLMLILSCVTLSAHADIFEILNPGRPPRYEPGRPGRPERPDRPGQPGRPERPNRPGRPGDGGGHSGGGYNYSCRAVDDGWEEHSGGHYSCQDCLGSGHGNCIETCSDISFLCTAEGTDYRGNRYTVQGYGDTRYRAEDEAMYRCQSQMNYCQVTNCQTQEQVISRRYCR